MGFNFRSYNPSQSYLLPPSLDDWLPENHLARFISETVDTLDLRQFLRRYRANGQGNAAYHPVMMVKVLIYAYCVGIPSSRKIAKAMVDDVAFRWLGAGNFPDFRTISEFRRRHLDAFKGLFTQVLLLCKGSGLLKAGVVALDGTKVRANASMSRNRTYKRLCQEEEEMSRQVKELLDQAERIDQEEDAIYGDMRGDELPPELSDRKSRLKKIQEAKARLEAEAAKQKQRKKKSGKLEDSLKVNMTDPDSRIQKTRHGYMQGYNAQVTVNEEQVILAHEVVSDENDFKQLVPMVEATEENLRVLGRRPKTFLADAGYCSTANLEQVSEKDFEFLISTKAERKHGQEETGCIRGPRPKGLREQMARKLRRPLFQYLYRFRGRMVEPVFGQLKTCRGFSGFLFRGIEKVRCEFSIWCSTHNLLKLYRKRLIKAVNTA